MGDQENPPAPPPSKERGEGEKQSQGTEETLKKVAETLMKDEDQAKKNKDKEGGTDASDFVPKYPVRISDHTLSTMENLFPNKDFDTKEDLISHLINCYKKDQLTSMERDQQLAEMTEEVQRLTAGNKTSNLKDRFANVTKNLGEILAECKELGGFNDDWIHSASPRISSSRLVVLERIGRIVLGTMYGYERSHLNRKEIEEVVCQLKEANHTSTHETTALLLTTADPVFWPQLRQIIMAGITLVGNHEWYDLARGSWMCPEVVRSVLAKGIEDHLEDRGEWIRAMKECIHPLVTDKKAK